MTIFGTKTSAGTPPRIDVPTKKPRIREIVHDGVTYQMPSVTTVIDGAIANPTLGDWRVNTACQDVVSQARGLYESLGDERLNPDAFESSLYRRIGSQWADMRIANREASGGSRVHDLIEWQLRGEMGLTPGPMPEHVSDATRFAFEAWKVWRVNVTLTPFLLEQEVYSVEYLTSGRFDLYGEVNGKCLIADWKTSKGIYPNYKIQLGGYYVLAIERGIQPIEGAVCVRLPKSDKQKFVWGRDVAEMDLDELKRCADLFIKAREIYRYLNGT